MCPLKKVITAENKHKEITFVRSHIAIVQNILLLLRHFFHLLSKAFHICCRKSTHSYSELLVFLIWRSEVLISRLEITNLCTYEKI